MYWSICTTNFYFFVFPVGILKILFHPDNEDRFENGDAEAEYL